MATSHHGRITLGMRCHCAACRSERQREQATQAWPVEKVAAADARSMTTDLLDYAWRERGLGVASPLTWAQQRTMRRLITQGKAEPLPMAEQRCWISADLRYLCAGATRVVVKPNGKMVLR